MEWKIIQYVYPIGCFPVAYSSYTPLSLTPPAIAHATKLTCQLTINIIAVVYMITKFLFGQFV